MKTFVYVDGFNLYYGAVKGTAYKWLNVAALAQLLLPQDQILYIKYFTARIKARPSDPDQPNRQQIFLRALRTIPNLEIIEGFFLEKNVWMPLVSPPPGGPNFVEVIKSEEKGSDVNIAAHMINDGYKGKYEAAVIISNDSDLVEAVKIVRHELKLVVGVLNPHKKPSHELKREASFIRQIRQWQLAASQFPDQIADAVGVFHKPPSW